MRDRLRSSEGTQSPARRRAWVESLHIFGLWALALAQPVYQLIAKDPQFLAAHNAGALDVLGLVFAWSFLFPALLAAVVLLSLPLGSRVRSIAQSAMVGLLVAAFFLQIAKRVVPGGGWGALALSLGAAGLFTVAYHRAATLRTFATFLSVAAVVVPLTFLLNWRILAILQAPAEVNSVDVRIGKPVPVVVVILDELPLVALFDDHAAVDAALFPNFARLGSRSHWFRNATTTGGHTDLAVPALHTGRHSSVNHEVLGSFQNYPNNLFTLLGPTYRVQALETTTDLLPRIYRQASDSALVRARLLLLDVAAIALHLVTPPPWDSDLPSIEVGWAGFWGDAKTSGDGPRGRIGEIRAFLEGLEAGPRPPFVYIHPRFPHPPWEYLPSGRMYYVPVQKLNDDWENDAWLTTQAYQRLLLQLQATDTLLGDMLDRFEHLGWLDDSILVVLSDHGGAFKPGLPRRNLLPEQRDTVLAEIMPVPLFVKLPGQREGFVHDEPVEIIDVLPTLGEVLETEIPWEIEGRSLLSPLGGERPPRWIQLQNPYEAVRFDRSESAPLEAMARERAAWFGRDAAGHRDLFRLGPDADFRVSAAADLIGSQVPAAVVSEPGYVGAILDQDQLHDVDVDADRIPAFIRGEIHVGSGSPPTAPLTLAIAVNGVVQAVTRTYGRHSGRVGFAAMVPESALQPGDNTVDVYLMDANRAFRRIETSGAKDVSRGKYESALDVLFTADAQSGWKGFRAEEADVAPDDSGGLAIVATGDLPLIEIPRFETAGHDAMMVAMEIESDSALSARLYYATADDPTFRPLRIVPARVQEGRSVVYFEVRATALIGQLSLDLLSANTKAGSPAARPRVVVHSFQARGLE